MYNARAWMHHRRACRCTYKVHIFFVSQNTAYDNLVFLAPFFNLSARPKPGDFTSYSCDKPLSLAPGSSLLPSFLSSRHRLRRRAMDVKKKRGAVLLVRYPRFYVALFFARGMFFLGDPNKKAAVVAVFRLSR